MTGALMPHVLDDWAALIDAMRANPKPKVGRGPITDITKTELVQYTRRIGPLATDDLRRISTAVDELLAVNAGAVNGSRQVLLVDGPAAMGKSQAVVAHALRNAESIWADRGRRVGGAEVIPYIYVEVAATGWARALMQSVIRFIGLPLGPREGTDEMLHRFRLLAPRLGVQAVIVDDAHMLRTASAESRKLTDFLKGAITSLPVSFIFVGAGLEDSALLRQSTGGGYSAAEQIARRATIVKVQPWPDVDASERWMWLLANLETQLVIPHSKTGMLTARDTAMLLHTRSGGRPGVMIDWVKRAAVKAITDGVPLSRGVLQSTSPPKPRPAR